MLVFVRKLTPSREQQAVDVLRQTHIRTEHIPIIRNPAKDHIPFDNLLTGHDMTLRLHEFLALTQGERTQIDMSSHPVVKASDIPFDLVQDPGRRRTADDQDYVLPHRAPSIPEMVQCPQKLGTRRIHPRAFVKEYNLPPRLLFLKHILQQMKCRIPVLRCRTLLASVSLQRPVKLAQLPLHGIPHRHMHTLRRHGEVLESRMFKGKPIMTSLAYKKRLSYTSPPKYRNKLRLIRVYHILKVSFLPCTTYHHIPSPP